MRSAVAVYDLALQQVHFVVFVQQIQVFGFSARRNVQVGLRANDSSGLDRGRLETLRQLGQLVEGRLVHEKALLL